MIGRETEKVPMFTKEEFERIAMGDIGNPEFEELCLEKGIRVSDDPGTAQEIIIDGGKIAKMVTYKGDFGTIIDEDGIHAQHTRFKPEVKYEGRPFSSKEFPAGAIKKFVDLETSETKEGSVVSLKVAEGKKIIELKMDDGSIVEVALDSIIEE